MAIVFYSVREAKARFSQILLQAQSDTIVITNHGNPVALIIGVKGLTIQEVVMAETTKGLLELLKSR